MTENDLLHALRDCYDPVQHRNIVDGRLVRSVALALDRDAPGAAVHGVAPRYIARLAIHAPGNDETVNAQMRAQIENRLAGIAAISRTEIEMLPALFPILSRGHN